MFFTTEIYDVVSFFHDRDLRPTSSCQCFLRPRFTTYFKLSVFFTTEIYDLLQVCQFFLRPRFTTYFKFGQFFLRPRFTTYFNSTSSCQFFSRPRFTTYFNSTSSCQCFLRPRFTTYFNSTSSCQCFLRPRFTTDSQRQFQNVRNNDDYVVEKNYNLNQLRFLMLRYRSCTQKRHFFKKIQSFFGFFILDFFLKPSLWSIIIYLRPRFTTYFKLSVFFTTKIYDLLQGCQFFTTEIYDVLQ